jgi:hypothetical protein
MREDLRSPVRASLKKRLHPGRRPGVPSRFLITYQGVEFKPLIKSKLQARKQRRHPEGTQKDSRS